MRYEYRTVCTLVGENIYHQVRVCFDYSPIYKILQVQK